MKTNSRRNHDPLYIIIIITYYVLTYIILQYFYTTLYISVVWLISISLHLNMFIASSLSSQFWTGKKYCTFFISNGCKSSYLTFFDLCICQRERTFLFINCMVLYYIFRLMLTHPKGRLWYVNGQTRCLKLFGPIK